MPKILPRLQRARHDACQADLVHSLAGLSHVHALGYSWRANQRAKTFTQTRPCHAPQANGTALSTQTAIPAMVQRLDFSQPEMTSNCPVSKDNLTQARPPKKNVDIRISNLVSTRMAPQQKRISARYIFVCADP